MNKCISGRWRPARAAGTKASSEVVGVEVRRTRGNALLHHKKAVFLQSNREQLILRVVYFLAGVECVAGTGVAVASGVAVAAAGLVAFLCFFTCFLAAGVLDVSAAGAA